MKMFSRKTRLAGAALLTASMVLAGTAWGESINPDNQGTEWDSSGMSVAGASLEIEKGASVTVDDLATISVEEDFEIYNGTVTLGNSTIITNASPSSSGDGYGFNIGWYDNGDPDQPPRGHAELIISSNKTATLNADGFFSIKHDGEVRLEEGATANITLYANNDPTKDGIFVLGNAKGINTRYASEFGSFALGGDPVDFENTATPGGLLYLETGSKANITGRAIFGAAVEGNFKAADDETRKSMLNNPNVGVQLGEGSVLNITGKAWFLENSLLSLYGDASPTENVVHATDIITVEENALVKVIGGKEGDIILVSDTGFANPQSLQNPVYRFAISGNNMVIDAINVKEATDAFGQSGNYAQSGALINRIVDTAGVPAELKGRLAANLQEIYFADEGTAEIAMKQLIGEEALAATGAFQNTINQSQQTLAGRFQAIRGNSSPAAGAGDNLNRLWVGGFGQWSEQKDKDDVYGYDYNSVGVMLGYDREVASLSGLTLGFSGSWSNGTVENNDGLAETDIDTFGLGLYGVYEFGNGFFMDADLGYGRAKNDASIDLVVGGKKTGDFDVTSFQAGLNFGYDFYLNEATTLTPSLGLRYTHIKQDGWREKIVSDPNNMAVANWFDDSTQNFLEIPVNLRLATEIQTQGGAVISPELRVGAVFTANDPKSSLRMGFVGSNDSVTIYGIEPGRSRFVAGAGIKAQLNDTVDIFAGYDLEGRSGYTGHSASLGLGFSF